MGERVLRGRPLCPRDIERSDVARLEMNATPEPVIVPVPADLFVLELRLRFGAADHRIGVVHDHVAKDGDAHLSQHQAEHLQAGLHPGAQDEFAPPLDWLLAGALSRSKCGGGGDVHIELTRRFLSRFPLADAHVDQLTSSDVGVARVVLLACVAAILLLVLGRRRCGPERGCHPWDARDGLGDAILCEARLVVAQAVLVHPVLGLG